MIPTMWCFTMARLLLTSSLAICAIDAFTSNRCAPARRSPTRLLAAGGAPQYDRFDATLREAERVARGSYLLRIDAREGVDYEPGHVLALEVQADEGGAELDAESKTHRDAKENGGWMRGPYTVSRSTRDSIEVLIKVVGDKSERFASAAPGTPVRFGGKFHVPILDGIDLDTTEQVVMISTGVGIGPCVGAIEKALDQEHYPPIHLIASYRTEEEVVYKDHLNNLQTKHPGKLSWTTNISSEQGRLSSTKDNLRALAEFLVDHGVEGVHYHLIGNGQMVSEFKSGLAKAQVPDDKVTIEMYFNHKAEVDPDTVDRIADAVKEYTAAGVVK
ncbi:hypothetical protein ACHAWF_016926 [Thalassiosira exigua]